MRALTFAWGLEECVGFGEQGGGAEIHFRKRTKDTKALSAGRGWGFRADDAH